MRLQMHVPPRRKNKEACYNRKRCREEVKIKVKEEKTGSRLSNR